MSAQPERNPEGLTWAEWIAAAGWTPEERRRECATERLMRDWRAGVDPSEERAAREHQKRANGS